MTVILQNQTNEDVPEAFLISKTEVLIEELAQLGIEISSDKEELVIVFVERAEGERLNTEFRNKEGPTDVLSFDPIEEQSLGELVLCLPVVKKQAEDHDLSFEDETLYLILHGILHLLGYDHERGEAEKKEMFSIQDEVFEKVRS